VKRSVYEKSLINFRVGADCESVAAAAASFTVVVVFASN